MSGTGAVSHGFGAAIPTYERGRYTIEQTFSTKSGRVARSESTAGTAPRAVGRPVKLVGVSRVTFG